MATESTIDSTSTLVAGIILTVVGAELFLVLPMVLAAAAGDLSLDGSEVGFLGSGAMAGAAVSAGLAVFWVRQVNWRTAVGIGLALVIIAHSLAILLHSYLGLLTMFAIAGMGGGTVYSVGITLLSDVENSDRAFGLSVTAQVAFQVVGMLVFPLVIDFGGLNAVLGILIALPILASLTLPLLPCKGRAVSVSGIVEVVLQPRAMLALAGCLLFFFNIGVFWSYIELMGSAEGFSPERVGVGLAIGVSIGMLGSLSGSWLGAKFGRLRALAWACVGTVVSLVFLTAGMSFWTYVAAVGVYNYVWNFSLVYQYALVAAVDGTGRCIAAVPAFHAIGAAAGPAVAALYLSGDNFLPVILIAAAAVIASQVLFVAALRLRIAGSA